MIKDAIFRLIICCLFVLLILKMKVQKYYTVTKTLAQEASMNHP